MGNAMRVRVIQLLLEYGANVHATNIYGYKPIHYAIENENFDLVNLLLKWEEEKEEEEDDDDDDDDYLIHFSIQKQQNESWRYPLKRQLIREKQQQQQQQQQHEEVVASTQLALQLAIERGNVQIA